MALENGLFFDQDWASAQQDDAGRLRRHPCRPDAPAARPTSARTWCCSSAAAPSVIPWASPPAPPPTAPRWKPWCFARNAGRDILERRPGHPGRGRQDLQSAAAGARYLEERHLRLRLDRLAGLRADGHGGRVTPATKEKSHAYHPRRLFSFLPDLTDEQIHNQVQYCHRQRLGGEPRVHRRPPSPEHLLGDVGPPDVRQPDAAAVVYELNECRKVYGDKPLSASRPSTRATAGSRSGAVVHRQPSQGDRSRFLACRAGGRRPGHPLHDPSYATRKPEGRATPDGPWCSGGRRRNPAAADPLRS